MKYLFIIILSFNIIYAFTCKNLSKHGIYKLHNLGKLKIDKDYQYQATKIMNMNPVVKAVLYYSDFNAVQRSELYYNGIVLKPGYCSLSSKGNILVLVNKNDMYDFTYYDYNLNSYKFSLREPPLALYWNSN